MGIMEMAQPLKNNCSTCTGTGVQIPSICVCIRLCQVVYVALLGDRDRDPKSKLGSKPIQIDELWVWLQEST